MDMMQIRRQMLMATPHEATASGNPATFDTDGVWPLKSLKVGFEPVQEGSGDPSPDNVRPITGWAGANVTVNEDVLDIAFPSSAGTVYGGTLDVVTGELVVNRAMVDMGDLTWTYRSGNAVFSGVKSDMPLNTPLVCSTYAYSTASVVGSMPDKSIWNRGNAYNVHNIIIKDTAYTDGATLKTAVTGQKIVYLLATPITYHLTPQQVLSLVGENTVYSDTNGGCDVTYWVHGR